MRAIGPMYDIFSGRFPNANVLWLQSVVGLAAARERMQTLAAQKPGPYFVFCTSSHAIVASVDSTRVGRTNKGAA
jgi:L-amino acid N-acyltransferase YncA